MASGQDTYNFGAAAINFASDPATSSASIQSLVPITPNMSSDALLVTHAASLGGIYSTAGVADVSAVVNPNSFADALFLQRLAAGDQGIQCENSQALGGFNGEPLDSQGYKFSEHLQGVLGMSSAVSTPPASVSSPDFLNTNNDIATITGTTLSQMSGLGYSQALHMHAPLSQSTTGNVTILATSEALYSTPIMGSTQMPVEPLFGHISYANAGSSAAFVPNMAAVEHNMQMYVHPQGLGQSGIPSLAHTPQPEHSLGMSDFYAMNTHAAHIPPSSLANSFSEFTLAGQQPATGLLPFGQPSTGNFSHLRLQRTLSIGEPERARSSSPSLNQLVTMPAQVGHPYMPRRNTSMRSNPSDMHAGSAQLRRIRSHTRTGSDIVAGCTPVPAMAPDLANWGRLGSPCSTQLSRASSGYKSRDASIVPGTGIMIYSSRNGDSDDGCSSSGDNDAESEPQRTPSGRIPLTREQREVFFHWLYNNAHDPKPKGSERDHLRCIGNMTRERFKTWFANARRRYFKITYNNGVQQYTVNERFRVACQRANIKLD
ncbi:hypothetical protein LPJ77_002009 [Coemansia sp. RSA 2523]|nr:hypothetical protein LPJ58_002207 [Coemansia sp. RSA 1591]KAJ1763965.1 hypothetical protein LPJ69_002137 [Coemansia sp. RSA 1752]KAJ1793834.1 hypothetical protein LPJ67_001150 [Coemansia sp. RSA 1938]KAJ1808932.1 hypothetical protein LPJ77_002009 [Coemansia sp. RSA 2523]KAJ2181254.1 hypothetical protein EV181_005275 [Coemansia sp. RSA 532]KAJ2715535.1 hypothetical protein H4S00_004817 [Coemansia sp. D1744]